MARNDPTFTGVDNCRFWLRNLDLEEQEDVFAFFIVAFALQTATSIPKKFFLVVLSLLVRFAPQPWRLVLRLVLRLFRITTVAEDALELYERAQRVAHELDTSIEEVSNIVAEFE